MSREYIAQTLKKLRLNSGLTADEVGEQIGKSGKTVNAWENNRGQPDAEILIELCDIYKVDNILEEFKENKDDSLFVNLSEHEKSVILAYRSRTDMQRSVDILLGLEPNNVIEIKAVARSSDNHGMYKEKISKTDLENLQLQQQPSSDDEL